MVKKLYVILAASMLHSATGHAAAAGASAQYSGDDAVSKQSRDVCNAFLDGASRLTSFPSSISADTKAGELGTVEAAYGKRLATAQSELKTALETASIPADRKGVIATAFEGFEARYRQLSAYLFDAIAPRVEAALSKLPDDRKDYGVAIVEGTSRWESAMYSGGEDGKAAFLTLLNLSEEIAETNSHVWAFHPYLNVDRWALFSFISGAPTVICGEKNMEFLPAWVDLLESYGRGEANTAQGFLRELAVINTLAIEAAKNGKTLNATISHPSQAYTRIADPAELNHALPARAYASVTTTQAEILKAAYDRVASAIAGGGAAAGAGAGAGAGATA